MCGSVRLISCAYLANYEKLALIEGSSHYIRTEPWVVFQYLIHTTGAKPIDAEVHFP